MDKNKIILLNEQIRKEKQAMSNQPSATKCANLNEYLQAMEEYQLEINKIHTKDPAKQNTGFLKDEIANIDEIAELTFSKLPSSLDDFF